MTNKNKILYELITKNVVDKNMFLLMCSNRKTAWEKLRWLEQNGYTRESSISYAGRASSTTDYIMLTSSGFIYAANALSRIIPWIEPVSATRKYSALGASAGDRNKIENFLRVSSAGILCDLIGGGENLQALASESEKAKAAETDNHILLSMPDIIQTQFRHTNPDNALRFYSERDMKSELLSVIKGKEQVFRQARLAGIYESPQRVAAVYVALKNNPVIWYESYITKEHAMTTTFRERCLPGDSGQPFAAEAVYITPNAKTLKIAAMGKAGSINTKGFNKTAPFGQPYLNTWIIETSHEGVRDLKKIMTSDVEQERQKWIDRIQKTEPVSPNNLYYTSQFPFLDEQQSFVAVWPYLTAQNLWLAKSFLEAFPQDSVKVYCRSWHIPYIQNFLGENTETVEMSADSED